MAAKKKAKKSQIKSVQATSKKKMSPTKKSVKKKPAVKVSTKARQATSKKKISSTKKSAKKKLAVKGQTPKKKSTNKAPNKATVRASGKKSKRTRLKPIRRGSQTADTVAFSPERPALGSSGQSGDVQGLSSLEGVDSESVVELLEEGNAFEAAIIAGVEEAGSTDQRVHTHEVPEDDVPDEYFDRD